MSLRLPDSPLGHQRWASFTHSVAGGLPFLKRQAAKATSEAYGMTLHPPYACLETSKWDCSIASLKKKPFAGLKGLLKLGTDAQGPGSLKR